MHELCFQHSLLDSASLRSHRLLDRAMEVSALVVETGHILRMEGRALWLPESNIPGEQLS